MLVLVVLLAAASAVSAGSLAVSIHREALRSTTTTPSPRLRRDVSVNALNNVTGGGYYAEFSVGTPPQKLSFLLDTGSSDTWVNSVDADLCRSPQQQESLGAWCQAQFDPRASSSLETLSRGGFNISYLDGRAVSGDYISDTVTLAGKTITRQQLGLALRSTRPTGIMGLGFSANVAARTPYPTVVDSMVSQGVINAPIFSIFLNDLDASSGTILFGAIDSQKYYGRLASLPLLSDAQAAPGSNATSYTVRLQSFAADGVSVAGVDAAAVLDSGSTISLLPDSVVVGLHQHFGVRTVRGLPAPLVDCAYRGRRGRGLTFDFGFDGVTIKVPIDEMVIDAFPDGLQQEFSGTELAQTFGAWEKVCVFGVGAVSDFGITSNSFALLGDTFLRSAYVVFDMANRLAGMAQANHRSDRSNIVEVSRDARQLPDVPGAPADNAAAGAASPAAALAVAAAALAAAAVAL